MLGLIATRSTETAIPGIKNWKPRRTQNRSRHARGLRAEALRSNAGDDEAKVSFERNQADLGYGLLLKRNTADVNQATPEMIRQAARDTAPRWRRCSGLSA